jgi:RNA polymerase sigma-70 factor (ECF subfamily)
MHNPSDQELILQLQEDSLEALGKLFDRHRLMVYRTALAIANDPEAAADLLQDVFLRLYRFAERVDPCRPLEPWLYRVTTNLAYTYVKRRQRWFSPLEDIAEWLVGSKKQTPHHMAEVDEESQQVQQAIASLPLQQRVVIVLYYINDLSLHEIAEIIGVPEGTVKSRLHYGRKALKKYLKLEGEFLPDMHYEFT